MANSNVECKEANFMATVQDENKLIVRTKELAFFLCSTMSSEDTKAKFDFTDPAYCTKCEKFDPENDIMLEGEDGDVDTEESITASQEEESEKDNGKESKEKDNAKEHHKVVMTRDMKLN